MYPLLLYQNSSLFNSKNKELQESQVPQSIMLSENTISILLNKEPTYYRHTCMHIPTAPTVLVPKLSEPPGANFISPVNLCLNLITKVERVIKPCLPMLRIFQMATDLNAREIYVSCIIRRTCHDLSIRRTCDDLSLSLIILYDHHTQSCIRCIQTGVYPQQARGHGCTTTLLYIFIKYCLEIFYTNWVYTWVDSTVYRSAISYTTQSQSAVIKEQIQLSNCSCYYYLVIYLFSPRLGPFTHKLMDTPHIG